MSLDTSGQCISQYAVQCVTTTDAMFHEIFDCVGADIGAWVGVVGASVEAGVQTDASTGVGIGVSVHTLHLETCKDLRHRKSSTIGWRNRSTVHLKLSPTHDDQCTIASPRARERVFCGGKDLGARATALSH